MNYQAHHSILNLVLAQLTPYNQSVSTSTRIWDSPVGNRADTE